MVQAATAVCTVPSNNRLCITDRTTGLCFLVDTGANVSVLPSSSKRNVCRSKETNYKLYAANGTEISTYGHKTLILDLNLRRPFLWTFILADVTQPILGADFLFHHRLLVDLCYHKLIDKITNLNIITPVINSNHTTINTVELSHPYYNILSQYPDITKPVSFKETPKHAVFHHIETLGPPVHAKARPLTPDGYKR